MLARRLQPDYGNGVCLNDEDLNMAAHLYGQWKEAADERLLQAQHLSADPLVHCFICRTTMRTHLNDGEGQCMWEVLLWVPRCEWQ